VTIHTQREPIIGLLTATSQDSLAIATDTTNVRASLMIPKFDVRRLERRITTTDAALSGFVGFLLGSVTGLAVTFGLGGDCGNKGNGCFRAGAVFGLVAGLAVGSKPTDSWQPASGTWLHTGALRRGDALRITVRDSASVIEGRLVSRERDELGIGAAAAGQGGDVHAHVKIVDVISVERRQETANHSLLGAILGGAGGAVYGALGEYDCRLGDRCRNGAAQITRQAAAGALMGALVGSFFKKEKWIAVPRSGLAP
jgi:hypothetical protein